MDGIDEPAAAGCHKVAAKRQSAAGAKTVDHHVPVGLAWVEPAGWPLGMPGLVVERIGKELSLEADGGVLLVDCTSFARQ